MSSTEELRTVTVKVPTLLLQKAQRFIGAGPTQTIIAGLEKLAASKVYQQMRNLRGSCPKIELDVAASRADRDRA